MIKLEISIEDTIERVKKGNSVYNLGALEPHKMIQVSNEFANRVDHDGFVEGLQNELKKGGNPEQWVRGYISVMFALGFQAGSRHETLNRLES